MSSPTVSNLSQPPSSDPVIQLDNVSVQYRVPHERITSFKEYAIRRIKRTITYTNFLALNNVSLTVQRGESLGLIGHNGAGKSTLLKVVSRVLRPTEGRVRVRGRIAPLLELGTGFDFELTGRENVYLNSAMLGYSRRDTETRFERIVEFAGLGDFIDAPLRTYSTGMVARLGFTIATDVNPDILIVDEVLSVGDEQFKQKSSDRMAEFYRRGKTIMLVTHSMEMIQQLCQRVIWMSKGQVHMQGTPDQIIPLYQAHARQNQL